MCVMGVTIVCWSNESMWMFWPYSVLTSLHNVFQCHEENTVSPWFMLLQWCLMLSTQCHQLHMSWAVNCSASSFELLTDFHVSGFWTINLVTQLLNICYHPIAFCCHIGHFYLDVCALVSVFWLEEVMNVCIIVCVRPGLPWSFSWQIHFFLFQIMQLCSWHGNT